VVAVDICNLALGYLGDQGTVASIDPPDGSMQAEHCARFYPMAQSLLLEAHEWSFITKRVPLALLTSPYGGRWQYAYALPADAGRIISIIPMSCYGSPGLLSGLPTWVFQERAFPFEFSFELDRERWLDFECEVDVNGRQVLLSNVVNAVARYTSSQVQTNVFPAMFTDALAWKLASMLAGPMLKGDAGAAESKRCLQMSASVASQAMIQDANQRHDAPRPQPVWMRDR
jgi:hypothetical protein